MKVFYFCFIYFYFFRTLSAQNIAEFLSVTPGIQTSNFVFPASHQFQKIIEHGDPISNGTMNDNFDFTAFISVGSSAENGYLSINHELTPGGVTIMDLHFDPIGQLWEKSNIQAIDFSNPSINETARNCSGGLTPWGNVISCEEALSTSDTNGDGYNDIGWHVEINPITRSVVGKMWSLGCGQKENIVIHNNRRTAYFGNDANPGYLFKFVANNSDDLSNGNLYVYTGPKNGAGTWVQIANTSIADRNNTMSLCNAAGATVYNGIEDVEIGPDGKIYFAVKNENRIYRFHDNDPISGLTTLDMETYAGNASYNITHAGGTTSVPWGTGNDNLAFDGQGNLWVLQDGGNNYIWVVMNDHSQTAPNVKLFGIAPAGSEPTGINFTPDFRYLFMSFQHPSATNNSDLQSDAAGINVGFGKDIAIVIALEQFLGCHLSGQLCNDGNESTANDVYNNSCQCAGIVIADSIEIGINSGGDDVEENILNGSLNAASSDLEMVTDGSIHQKVGLRFNNIPILRGALIKNAFIQFTTDETTSAPTTITLHTELSGHALPYITTDTFSVSERLKSTDSLIWTIPAWSSIGEAGTNQKSPDLKSIVQQVINHPQWQYGNSFSFIISGEGSRVTKSYDLLPAAAPKLTINYVLQNVNNIGIGTESPATKLHIKDGDVFLETIGSGMILKSPDGNCWRIKVSNDGTLQSISIPCPDQ